MGTVIDVHTHVVPSRLAADSGRDSRWPSVELSGDQAAVMIGGKVFRKIDARSWDVGRRLSDMVDDGTDMQVLSPMPELLSHWLPAVDAEYLAEIVNQHIAAMVAQAPDRFMGIGMVCAQDIPRAVRQLQTIKALGFAGIEIGTHINGVALGSNTLLPLYEAAEAMDLVVFVHPLHPVGVERIGSGPEFAAVAAFPLETALAAVSLLAAGIPERFPRLRILLSHGGGALSWILPRLDVGWSLGLRGQMQQSPSKTARQFWYDTILYDAASLSYLARAVGSDHIVVGSDYPFTIMQKQPGAFAASALNATVLTENAVALLGRICDVRTIADRAEEDPGSKQGAVMVECRSLPQMCLLGPIPPRTPGRSDAQVPSDLSRGESKYGRIPFVYFYEKDAQADPAFGLLDIEISIQRRGHKSFQFEIYCIGDGYQSGHGSSELQPLAIEFRVGDRAVAKAEWSYPAVLDGHMDPLSFSAGLDLNEADFQNIDSVLLPSVRGEVTICLD